MKHSKSKEVRKVSVFTGSRAEYGLILPIIKGIQRHKNLTCSVIAAGSHLDKKFGSTLSEIYRDGVEVSEKVYLDTSGDDLSSTVTAIGTCVIEMGKILQKVAPDFLIVYADRFEGFGAVIAASQMNIPTVHVEGGDITDGGALDDSVRHAMTKLSHLHFTTNEDASNRLLAMGEEPWRVCTAGLPAMDMISEEDFEDRFSVLNKLNLNIQQPIILFTQHSVTTQHSLSKQQVKPSLKVLKDLAKQGYQVLITFPNNDAGGLKIIDEINMLGKQRYENIQIFESLGRRMYHGVLALARDQESRVVCVGNSSSGLKETAVFRCPAVNIGTRQMGRLRAGNVIDAGYNYGEILTAINTCLFEETFRKKLECVSNPYGVGGVGDKIAGRLASVDMGSELLNKKMTLKGEKKNGWYR